MKTSTQLLSQIPTVNLEREFLLARADLERHCKLAPRMLALTQEVIPSNPLDLKEIERFTQTLNAFSVYHKDYLDKLTYVMEIKSELGRREYAQAKAKLAATVADLFKGMVPEHKQDEFVRDVEKRFLALDTTPQKN
jgi:hypothetical protein